MNKFPKDLARIQPMHVNRFIHWAFEGRSCFCATRLVLTEFSNSRIYSTQVIHSFHSRTICRLSKILYGSSLLVYISSTQVVAWLVLYPADLLPALSPSRGISCRTLLYVFLAIAVFLRKPVQGLRIYSQSFVYHLTGLFGTNIIGQLGW